MHSRVTDPLADLALVEAVHEAQLKDRALHARQLVPGRRYRLVERRRLVAGRRLLRLEHLLDRAADVFRDLVLAFLERREERWTVAWVEAGQGDAVPRPRNSYSRSSSCATNGSTDDFEACSFINALLEMAPRIPLAARASGISRASARLSVVSQRRPHCVTQRPLRARGTFS
jgi:hypothetical protein